MEPNPSPEPAAPRPPGTVPSLTGGSGRERRKRRKRARDHAPPAYAALDTASGWLIYLLVIFTPWAFGTTQTWSLWTANVACYALGALLVTKWIVRWNTGFEPPRWGAPDPNDFEMGPDGERLPPRRRRDFGLGLLVLATVALLGLVLVSLLNARADFNERTRELQYLRESIAWLPRTYDRTSTLAAFAQYCGLACAFWAIRDWLRYRSASDRKESESASETGLAGAPPGFDGPPPVPSRVRRLLWVLCLSGAMLAVVGILQRAAGTNKLLFLLASKSNKPATSVFGPWSYRSNAAEYFNLLWPACLAFWLWLQERANRSADRTVARFDGPQLVLVPCVGLMAAAPTVSTSRAAAAISALLGVAILLLLLLPRCQREISARIRYAAMIAIAIAGLGALVVGGATLRDRVSSADTQHPTTLRVGSGDFSLVAKVRLAEMPRGERRPLLGLSANPPGTSWLYNFFELELQPDGSLYAALKGGSRTNVDRLTIPSFTSRFSGRDILLAAIRSADGVRLYVDGEPLPGTANPVTPTVPPIYVDSGYVFAHPRAVTEVALLGLALDPADIRSLATVPLAELVRSRGAIPPVTATGDALRGALTLPDGVTANAGPPATTTLQRQEGSGVLGFRWNLPATTNAIRSRVGVSFVARNPSAEPLVLGVNVDAGPRSLVEVPAGEEETVTAVCRVPHTDQPRQVDVVVIAPGTTRVRAATAGSSFGVRDLKLASQTESMYLALEEHLSMDSLRLRMTGRPEILANSHRMAADYPIWGSGAGTFSTLYDLYRQPHEMWAGYVHNDWLETRITLGWVGLGILVVALVVLLARSWGRHGTGAPGIFVQLLWLGLGGCLLHAIGDFPFQIYSVLFLFITLCALLSVLTGRRPAGRGFR